MGIVSFEASGGMTSLPLGAGETVEVRLAENPTTGFRWEPVDLDQATLTSDSFLTATAAGVGATGTRVFVIRPAPRTRVLRFVLRRAWEEVPPRAEAVVRIEGR